MQKNDIHQPPPRLPVPAAVNGRLGNAAGRRKEPGPEPGGVVRPRNQYRERTSFHAAPPPSSNGTFKWERGELVGEGTYGRVYLALNKETGKTIVVKQVEPAPGKDDVHKVRQKAMVRILELPIEAYNLKGINHPTMMRCLKIYGFRKQIDWYNLNEFDHPNLVRYLGVNHTPGLRGVNMYVPSLIPADSNS